MKFKLNKLFILLIFFLNLGFRLYFVSNTEFMSDDFSYFHLRNLIQLKTTGQLGYDSLSYGGRDIFYPLIYYYAILLFSLLLPLELIIKILPEILISILPVIIYLTVKLIVRNKYIALFSGLVAGFLPVTIQKTLNQASIYSLALPLIFLMFYLFLEVIYKKKNIGLFIILSFILPIIHPSTFIFVLTLIFYSILLFSESVPIKGIKLESILFSIFIMLIIGFITYNKAFLEYGIKFVYANSPLNYLETFRGHKLSDPLNYIGIIPLIFGSIGIYLGIFKYRKNSVFLFSSLILSTIALLLFSLIEYDLAMMFMGLSFSIMAGIALKHFFSYLEITKFQRYKNIIIIAICVITFISIYPSFGVAFNVMDNTLTTEEVEIIQRMGGRVDDDSSIMANIEEGHYITYFANRKNVADTYYLFAPDVDQRLNDIDLVYTSWSRAIALNTLHKYKVSYIYLSERTKLKYNIEDLKYIEDEKCFKKVDEYKGNKFYQVGC